jgi:hypothetical protein
MRIVTDTKSINRNIQIGRYAQIAGIVLLVLALFANLASWGQLNQTTADGQLTAQQQQLVIASFIGLLLGYTLTTIAQSINLRYAPRVDNRLADALRGLDGRHTLYNYRLGASHVLVAPSGVYAIAPRTQSGPISYTNGKWKHHGSRGGLLRLFARDTLGNPVSDAQISVDEVRTFLKKQAPDLAVEPKPLIVFLNPRAVLEVDESPVPALHVKQLKDHIRRQPKAATITSDQLRALEQKLGYVATDAPAEADKPTAA